MASERLHGLYAALTHPAIYGAVQKLMRADAVRRHFADTYIRARRGDRVLDIGCGPAYLLTYLPQVQYIGWDPNPAYIARAKAAFGERGEFHTGLFGPAEAAALDPVDVAIVSGVLHHMDDDQARGLFALLRSTLRPGGRVVTLDNVYVVGQNPIARFIISRDRGRYVRTPEGYLALARASFPSACGTVTGQIFPPYTRFFMTAALAP